MNAVRTPVTAEAALRAVVRNVEAICAGRCRTMREAGQCWHAAAASCGVCPMVFAPEAVRAAVRLTLGEMRA